MTTALLQQYSLLRQHLACMSAVSRYMNFLTKVLQDRVMLEDSQVGKVTRLAALSLT